MNASSCRSGRWLAGSGCIAVTCGRRWSRRCRHRGRRRSGRRRRWTSSRRSSTAGSKRIRSLPRKQRHTARRVWQRLVDEHDADVGESTVRRYVKVVRERQADSVDRGGGPAASSVGRGGRGRFRVDPRLSGRRADRGGDVRHAAVGVGAGVPGRLSERGPGGVPRWPCPGVRTLRRDPGPGPLRQLESGGRQSA